MAAKYEYWCKKLKRVMCKTDKNMAEAEESDAMSLNISLKYSKNTRTNLLPTQNQMNAAPSPHAAMTIYTTATPISTTQEGPTYWFHIYFIDDDSISTMNTL